MQADFFIPKYIFSITCHYLLFAGRFKVKRLSFVETCNDIELNHPAGSFCIILQAYLIKQLKRG